jgi:NhaP-type Na+/H+ or K+/H+ antiporter
MARGLPSGKFRQRVVAVFGGLMGAQNLAAWGVAGVVAYYLWIKPERDLKEEQEVRYNSTTIISKQRIDCMHSSHVFRLLGFVAEGRLVEFPPVMVPNWLSEVQNLRRDFGIFLLWGGGI